MKDFVRILTILSIACACLLGAYVFDLIFVQWAQRFGWSSPLLTHSPVYLIFYLAWVLSFLLLVALVVLRALDQQLYLPKASWFGVWVMALIMCVGSYFPTAQQYVALAVVVLGPGSNSVRLQRDAAIYDSNFLLSALSGRGAMLDETLLVLAARNDSVAVASKLISLGWDVNARRYQEGITPLHAAIERSMYRAAALLLAAGARVDLADKKGVTALQLAKKLNDPRMLELLAKFTSSEHADRISGTDSRNIQNQEESTTKK
jgi:hypothetical protein